MDDTLCSVLSWKNKRITHVSYNDIELYEDICLKEKNGTQIYDLENWYDLKGVKQLENGNWWVTLENDRMVYKGDILDIEFEMCVEDFFENGIDPTIVIDKNEGAVFIYTEYLYIDRANEIINKVCNVKEDDELYINLDLSEILALDPSSPRYKIEEDIIFHDK